MKVKLLKPTKFRSIVLKINDILEIDNTTYSRWLKNKICEIVEDVEQKDIDKTVTDIKEILSNAEKNKVKKSKKEVIEKEKPIISSEVVVNDISSLCD